MINTATPAVVLLSLAAGAAHAQGESNLRPEPG